MRYLAIHLILVGYLAATYAYSTHLKLSLPITIQWIVGVVNVVGLLAFFLRLDLICIDPTLNSFTHPDPFEKRAFFLKVLQFYLLLLGVPIILISGFGEYPVVKPYLTFLLIANILGGSRYAVPSYRSYVSRHQSKTPWVSSRSGHCWDSTEIFH